VAQKPLKKDEVRITKAKRGKEGAHWGATNQLLKGGKIRQWEEKPKKWGLRLTEKYGIDIF